MNFSLSKTFPSFYNRFMPTTLPVVVVVVVVVFVVVVVVVVSNIILQLHK